MIMDLAIIYYANNDKIIKEPQTIYFDSLLERITYSVFLSYCDFYLPT